MIHFFFYIRICSERFTVKYHLNIIYVRYNVTTLNIYESNLLNTKHVLISRLYKRKHVETKKQDTR